MVGTVAVEIVVVVVVLTVVDVDDATTVVGVTVVVDSLAEVTVSARTSCGGNPGLVSAGTKEVGKAGNGLVIEEPMVVENLLFLITTVI